VEMLCVCRSSPLPLSHSLSPGRPDVCGVVLFKMADIFEGTKFFVTGDFSVAIATFLHCWSNTEVRERMRKAWFLELN
jgi:hypothetical protein